MKLRKPIILILCTGNSCRSQIAEAFFREAIGEEFEIASAGTKPAGFVRPEAIACMADVGIDISTHRSMHVSEFLDSSDLWCSYRVRPCGGPLSGVSRFYLAASLELSGSRF